MTGMMKFFIYKYPRATVRILHLAQKFEVHQHIVFLDTQLENLVRLKVDVLTEVPEVRSKKYMNQSLDNHLMGGINNIIQEIDEVPPLLSISQELRRYEEWPKTKFAHWYQWDMKGDFGKMSSGECFFRFHRSDFPRLWRILKLVYSCPSTSISIERRFNKFRRFFSPENNQILSGNLKRECLFMGLHSALSHLQEISKKPVSSKVQVRMLTDETPTIELQSS